MDVKPQNAEPRAKPRLRWYQYSLRTLLIGIVVLSLPCGWFGWKLRAAQRQRAVVEALLKSDISVRYDFEFEYDDTITRAERVGAKPPGPAWLRAVLGDDLFRSVYEIILPGRPAKPFTDVDLAQLEDVPTVRLLYLDDAQVTDAGLRHLEALTKLEALWLERTRVTDAGLEHLKGLTRLRELWLIGSAVTDAGEAKLQSALPDCEIIR